MKLGRQRAARCVLAKKEKTAIANVKKDMTAYNNFANVVNNYAVKLKSALRNAHEKGIKVFLYGTGARACTLINGLGIEEIDCAIDDQKEKQNHYMPGSHLPILSLEKVSDSADKKVFLLAVNHENEEMVSKKILLHNNAKNVKIISLFAPNDIFKEVEKVEELL